MGLAKRQQVDRDAVASIELQVALGALEAAGMMREWQVHG